MPEVGFCRDCRWWESKPESEYQPLIGHFGFCDRISLGADMRATITFGGYFSDGNSNALMTREDFGCVIFEAKEQA